MKFNQSIYKHRLTKVLYKVKSKKSKSKTNTQKENNTKTQKQLKATE